MFSYKISLFRYERKKRPGVKRYTQTKNVTNGYWLFQFNNLNHKFVYFVFGGLVYDMLKPKWRTRWMADGVRDPGSRSSLFSRLLDDGTVGFVDSVDLFVSTKVSWVAVAQTVLFVRCPKLPLRFLSQSFYKIQTPLTFPLTNTICPPLIV